MADTFHAQILTPEGKLFDGEVLGVQVPGSSGSFEMLANHAPIISTLEIGVIRIHTPDRSTLYLAVSGGFVEMNKNRMTLLAEAAEKAEEIDVDRAKLAKERALELLSSKDADRIEAEVALKRAVNRLTVVEKLSRVS